MLYFLNGLQKAFSTWLGLIRIEQISYRKLSAAYPHNTANRTVQFLWFTCGRDRIDVELSAHATCAW